MANKRKFSYGKRNLDPKFEHHWEEVDIKNFKLTKPLVLVLGGSGTVSNEESNGNLKVVESLLGVFTTLTFPITLIYPLLIRLFIIG